MQKIKIPKKVYVACAIILAVAIICVFILIPNTHDNDNRCSEENSLSEEESISLEDQTEEDSSQRAVVTSAGVSTTNLPTTTRAVPSTTHLETTIQYTTENSNKNVEQVNVNSYSVPYNGGSFKSYTNYQLLSKSSPQWNKIQCNSNAYTDENGLRKVGEYYCVAMGSYYTRTLGDLFEIQTEGGSFKVIICDFKADVHTDSNNQCTLGNGWVIEFYVDMSRLNSTARQMGDISYVDSNFRGSIISINKIGNYFA